MTKRQIIVLVIGGLIIVIGVLLLIFWPTPTPVISPVPEQPSALVEEPAVATSSSVVMGTSVAGRTITAYQFGTGDTHLMFVGGIHGGYEWNSVLLGYQMIDEMINGSISIPDTVTIHIIPNLNPDGTFAITGTDEKFTAANVDRNAATGTGRFNANNVDLNRNFDCKWQPESTWRGSPVSAGTAAFSEPEAAALRDYVTTYTPVGVVFWHSQADAVYASECEDGILPGTRTLMKTYATAAGYKTVDVFDAYPVTGDAEGWLASIGIPAITVEFKTHNDMDLEKNRAGVIATLEYYSVPR